MPNPSAPLEGLSAPPRSRRLFCPPFAVPLSGGAGWGPLRAAGSQSTAARVAAAGKPKREQGTILSGSPRGRRGVAVPPEEGRPPPAAPAAGHFLSENGRARGPASSPPPALRAGPSGLRQAAGPHACETTPPTHSHPALWGRVGGGGGRGRGGALPGPAPPRARAARSARRGERSALLRRRRRSRAGLVRITQRGGGRRRRQELCGAVRQGEAGGGSGRVSSAAPGVSSSAGRGDGRIHGNGWRRALPLRRLLSWCRYCASCCTSSPGCSRAGRARGAGGASSSVRAGCEGRGWAAGPGRGGEACGAGAV